MKISDLQKTVDSTRKVWGVAATISTIGVLIYADIWFVIFWPILLLLSYHALIFVTLLRAAMRNDVVMTEDDQMEALAELQRRFDAGETEGPEIDELKKTVGIIDDAELTVSPTKIGSYMDNDIHEWVEITQGGETRRFQFEMVAPKDSDGGIVIPDDGNQYLHFNGLLYKL